MGADEPAGLGPSQSGRKIQWYRYLTNELDPLVLPIEQVAALYRQRWRIEDAFNLVKRLLGLAYFWTGSENGVCLQLWATWLLYAVLVDLTDAVAKALDRPSRPSPWKWSIAVSTISPKPIIAAKQLNSSPISPLMPSGLELSSANVNLNPCRQQIHP